MFYHVRTYFSDEKATIQISLDKYSFLNVAYNIGYYNFIFRQNPIWYGIIILNK